MKNKYIKSPLQYTGGKYKLLPQILPLFPDNISTFVDLFGGGFNVGINVNAEHIIYNDTSEQVVDLLEYFKREELNVLLGEIDTYIEKYNLSKENKEGYLKLKRRL